MQHETAVRVVHGGVFPRKDAQKVLKPHSFPLITIISVYGNETFLLEQSPFKKKEVQPKNNPTT